MLDDVVMSVDAGHRREVCQLLSESFGHRQFLITTHDRTWANQLKSMGMVSSKSMVEFFNWHVDTGPLVCYEEDVWYRIYQALQRNDVPTASFILRRALEQFFMFVCDALRAEVVFRLDGKWELGEYLSSAMGRYSRLLRRAQDAAQSWGQTTEFENFGELDSIKSEIFQRTNVEQWAVNVNVHYTNWATFTKEDFEPVVDAFHDLTQLFVCTECGSMLSLSFDGATPTAVRCRCGKVNWNIEKKKPSIDP